MVANLFQPSLARAVDNQGLVAAGAKMFFYLAQSTTFAVQYIDAAGLTPGTNPRVADAYGKFAPVYIDPSLIYRVVLKNNDESEVFFDVDDIRGYDLGMITDFAAQVALDRVAVSADKALAESAAATALNASSAAISVSLASGAYSNAYASTLPKGVTSISITAAGSGYTNGTYALGVSGGPTGFAGTYTVTGNAVTSVTITNPGLATATTAPTLSFPSGGGTGATATATVASLIADQKTYWAASSDSLTIGLYRNNAGTPTAVANPDSSAITVAQPKLLDNFFQSYSPFVTAPASSSALFRCVGPPEFYSTAADGSAITIPPIIGIDEFANDGSNRCRIRLAKYATTGSAAVIFCIENPYGESALNTDTTGLTGVNYMPLYAIDTSTGAQAGEQIGVIPVRIETFGTYYPFTHIPYSQGGLSRWKIGDTPIRTANVGATAVAAVAKRRFDSPFIGTSPNQYLLDVIDDISIEGGVPGRQYELLCRNDQAGGNYRFYWYLYDPIRGANVAVADPVKTGDWRSGIPECLYLSGAAHGGPRGDVEYCGTAATVWFNKSKASLNQILLTPGTGRQTINPNRIKTWQEVREMVLTGKGVRNKVLTIGPTKGDFATYQAAVDSLTIAAFFGNDPALITRSAFPYSYIATPSNQYSLVPVEAITENRAERVPSGIATGMLMWPGLTLEAREDTYLYTDPTASACPLFDANYGGRIVAAQGARFRVMRSDSYIVHIDSENALCGTPTPNAADKKANIMQFRHTFLWDGGQMLGQQRGIGHGIADYQHVEFRNLTIKLEATSGLFGAWLAHTSPASVQAGDLIFDSVRQIGGGDGIALIKSNNGPKHRITLRNSAVNAVTLTNSLGGTSTFVLNGAAPAGTTVDSALIPS